MSLFEKNDNEYLLRHLGCGNLVLFLGAGFSAEALNRSGSSLPTSEELASQLWELLDYDEPHEDDSLADVYEACLTSGVPYAKIWNEVLEWE